MHQKIRSAKFKSLDGVNGAKPGTFSAVVAVYGNVDSVGDRIIEGAFDKSLKAWQALGDPIPIVLAHEWKDPFKHIGYAMPNKIKSVPGVGLVVEEGFLDVEDNPLAKQVHKLMERRTLKEFSFGYGIPQGGQTKASDGAMDLKALDLIEFGPCLKGVNDKTELLSIKSQLTHEGVYVPSFEERLERIEAMLMENTKAKMSPGRARWRSQKRHPETGRWIDETSGAGFDGRKRTVSSKFGAAKIDGIRKGANSNPDLSGSDKSMVNRLLNEAEEKFLAGDNKGGESKVEMAVGIKPVKPLMTSSGAREQHMEFLQGQVDDKFISPKVRAEAAAELEVLKNNPQLVASNAAANKFGFSDEGSSVPGTVSRDDQSDTDLSASKEDVEMVTSNMDKVDAMIAAGEDPDTEDDGSIGDLMGNLHVDMEQANFPPEVEKRYAALEKKWQDEMDAWSGDGDDTRGPIGGDEDNSADEDEIDNVNSVMDAVEGYLNDPYSSDIGGPDDLDDMMGNLHVDMEQANFPADVEKRYAALEKRWIDDDIGTDYSGPVGTPPKTNAADKKVLNNLLDENIGMSLSDADEPGMDRDQVEAFLNDVVSHSEMYMPKEVDAAEKWLSTGNFEVPDRMDYDPNFHTEADNIAKLESMTPLGSDSIKIGGVAKGAGAAIITRNEVGYNVSGQTPSGKPTGQGFSPTAAGAIAMAQDYVDGNSGPIPGQSQSEYDARANGPDSKNPPAGTAADQREVQAMADELGAPVMNPFTGKWVQPSGSPASPANQKVLNDLLDENIGLSLDDTEDQDQIDAFLDDVISHEEMYTPAQVEAAKQHLGYSASEVDKSAATSTMDKIEAMLKDPKANIDDLDWQMSNLHVDLEQSEFPPAIVKRWTALEKKWLKSPKAGKARRYLSLDAQITQMQADAAIYTATADLESKGFDLEVTESRDSTLQRLDELEAEVM